jgi:DNA-binding GntR family transcriptional regulator
VLKEDERLTERDLAAALGMSRTPVREALQRLQVEGLAKEVPGAGLVVFKSTPREVEEIYSVRVRLEGMAAELAARLATPGDVAFLEQLQTKIEAAARRRRFDEATSLNRQFHEAVCRIGRNEKLAWLVDLLHDIVQKAHSTTWRYPGRAAEANREHRMILEAIRRGDAEAARGLAERHMEHAKQIRLAMVSERGR